MYGPIGVGILNSKYKWLEAFEPFIGGGGMIDNVSKEDINYAKGAWKFEAGTMPTAEIIALNESINFINSIGKQEIIKHENQLTKKALKDLKNIKEVSVVGDTKTRGGVFSFNLKDIHSNDVSIIFVANVLEKRSKVRNFFEKSKSTICVAFYEDNIQTLCLIAQKFLRERKINIMANHLRYLLFISVNISPRPFLVINPILELISCR